MWLPGQVEVPEPVLLAQQQGRLVVFVGAGASVGPPSHPDLFLGGLEDGGVPVHQRVKASSSCPHNRIGCMKRWSGSSHRSTNCASSRRTTTST